MDNRKKYLRLKMNYTIAVSHPVKWQYQDGTVNDVQINCANGQKIMVNYLNQYVKLIDIHQVKRYRATKIIGVITFHHVYRVAKSRPRLYTVDHTVYSI